MATFLEKENSVTANPTRSDLLKRVSWAVGKYSVYILGGGSSDPDLIAWAKKALPGANAEQYADLMKRSVVNDGNYINGNAKGDTDAADGFLNSIVEASVNNIYKAL